MILWYVIFVIDIILQRDCLTDEQISSLDAQQKYTFYMMNSEQLTIV